MSAEGTQRVVEAAPGPKTEPGVGNMATITPGQAANPNENGILAVEQGSYHVHPKGRRVETTSNGMGGGTRTERDFVQTPTDPQDYNEARNYTSHSYVLGARSGTVTIYNGNGNVATFPLKKFISIGNENR